MNTNRHRGGIGTFLVPAIGLVLALALFCSGDYGGWASRVLVSDYIPTNVAPALGRTEATLDRVLRAIPTGQIAHLVFDAGPWHISHTTIVFHGNLVIELMPESYFYLAEDATCRFENAELRAGEQCVFSGPGKVEGHARFLYRVPRWGDDARYDIGRGEDLISTTYYPHVDLDYRDDVIAIENAGSGPVGDVQRVQTSSGVIYRIVFPYGSNGAGGGVAEMPVGSIIASVSTQIPPGWLLCDGASLSTNAFAELFGVIRFRYGWDTNGLPPGVTNFLLPDMRAMFLRGDNAGRTDVWADAVLSRRHPYPPWEFLGTSDVAAGYGLGSYQRHALAEHAHGVRFAATGEAVSGFSASNYLAQLSESAYCADAAEDTNWVSVTPSWAAEDETRPNNIAVRWLIRAVAPQQIYTQIVSGISGIAPDWQGPHSIRVSPGNGYCGERQFCLLSYYYITNITGPTSGFAVGYCYVDARDPTFPDSPQFYVSTSAPTFFAPWAQWLNETNHTDRCVGAIPLWKGTVFHFIRSGDEYVFRQCFSLGAVTNTYPWYSRQPTNLPSFLPVNANAGYFYLRSDDDPGHAAEVYVIPKEWFDLGMTHVRSNWIFWGSTPDSDDGDSSSWLFSLNVWLPVGPSRTLYAMMGDSDDTPAYPLRLQGWRIER